ncbi:hypothetical protein GCM10011369_28030 [Neiella marina]|uniref:Glycosyltransferase n=1 Tax=Neiella marina TaxID=508461 RepID=A0A8J2XQB6_9GAMM|nr:glycosyltransferase [Neiella marina]GGA84381.1 hypothetical protein GCM10011369_28030 [Neiella marina]
MDKKIYILPDPKKITSNSYYKTLLNCIAKAGYDTANASDFFNGSKLKRKGAVFVFSWQEDGVAKPNVYAASRHFLYILWVLIRIWFYKGKLIWIRHNVKPHKLADSHFISRFYYQFLVLIMGITAKHTLCHSKKYASQHGMEYVPHPTYKKNDKCENIDIPYLIYGKIMRYKQIDRVLLHWPINKSILLAGRFENSELSKSIRSIISERALQVEVIDQFVPDEQLAELLSRTRCVICGNESSSMIASGVIVHALSSGCAVIARRSPFSEELAEMGFPVFMFDSESELAKLTREIELSNISDFDLELEKALGADQVAKTMARFIES